MKFGQSVEYDMKNIFLEKLYKKFVRAASPRVIHKKSKLSISLNQQYEVL